MGEPGGGEELEGQDPGSRVVNVNNVNMYRDVWTVSAGWICYIPRCLDILYVSRCLFVDSPTITGSSRTRWCGNSLPWRLVLLPWFLSPCLDWLCALSFENGGWYLFDAWHWLAARDELYNMRKRGRVGSGRLVRVCRSRHDTTRSVIACWCSIHSSWRTVGGSSRRWPATSAAICLVSVKVYVHVELPGTSEFEMAHKAQLRMAHLA